MLRHFTPVSNKSTPGTVNDSFALVVSGDSISPVPIPGSYGMMLTGIGVLGFMARRKKNSAV
ncbi:MAG: VPLPA-CTERM sorting domain-containing protein [Methylophilaceae bacterium]|nr:VPLPA-CTERM sorting domain-containing protein [Methylophilaceae bacterium]